jgi:aryl-alcohol dehydrogenase
MAGIGAAINTGEVKRGESVAVIGCGGVGMAAIAGAALAGATTIIAVDLHQHRLDLALELGATHVLRGDADDLVAQLTTISAGGVHYAFDTTGVPAVIISALAGTRMTGKVGLVGVQVGDLVLDGAALIGKTVMGILEGGAIPQQFIPRMLELWRAGSFPFDRLIERFTLAEINEAEHASLSGRVIKPVLVPGH